MNDIDYASMSDEELKCYFLEHRADEAFYAYMDRLNARPRQAIVAAGELDHLPFDEQVRITTERMRARFGDKLERRNEEE